MLGVAYELAASGRPQEQLNTDQASDLSSGRSLSAGLPGEIRSPRSWGEFGGVAEFKIGDATGVPSTKGRHQRLWLKKLGGAKQARLESKARTRLLRLQLWNDTRWTR